MMDARLYTFILEFHGGTYISQTNATNLTGAINAWIAVHSEDDLATRKLSRSKLHLMVEENIPIALDGATGVWCITETIDGHFALLNIVDTCPV